MKNRYSRQIPLLSPIGQENLSKKRVAIVGLGGIGSTLAELLTRAGIGFLRLIDRDIIEITDLHRQILYDEKDLGKPKATQAKEKLLKINSQVEIDPRTNDLNPDTIHELLSGVDLILDATDNLETRYLINDFSISTEIPWIYASVIKRKGIVFSIYPFEGPCFRCLIPVPPTTHETCWTSGISPSLPSLVASIQVELAIQYLAQNIKHIGKVFYLDFQLPTLKIFNIQRNEKCKTCIGMDLEYLEGRAFGYAELLCGEETVQILPKKKGLKLDFPKLINLLNSKLHIKDTGHGILKIHGENFEMTLFSDGRALIKSPNITIEKAKSIYNDLIGL